MYVQEEKQKKTTNKIGKKSVNANTVTQYKNHAKQGFRFIDNRQEAVAQRKLRVLAREKQQSLFNKATQDAPVQLNRVSTPIDGGLVTMDGGPKYSEKGAVKSSSKDGKKAKTEDSSNDDAMVFLTPNTPAYPPATPSPPEQVDKPELGNQSAPVHLTKNVKRDSALTKIKKGGLTHDSLREEHSANLNAHLTLTSGFMTAALVSSPIKNYLVKSGKCGEIWGQNGTSTQSLSQEKNLANNIVTAFNKDLGLEEGGTFDNLMFEYEPKGGGPTFDQVVAFHDAVYETLNSTPPIEVAGDLPFSNISYSDMRAQIVSGADTLAAKWADWTGGGGKAGKTGKTGKTGNTGNTGSAACDRNKFRIAADKWTDLSKAANILNRIRVKALKLKPPEGIGFKKVAIDDDFFRQHLFDGKSGHDKEMDTIRKHLAEHNSKHAEEFE